MAIWLFGSRNGGEPRPESDVDVFLDGVEDLNLIPQQLLLCCGGPVDAFWSPAADGVAIAVDLMGEDERRLMISATMGVSWNFAVEPRAVTAEEVIALAKEVLNGNTTQAG